MRELVSFLYSIVGDVVVVAVAVVRNSYIFITVPILTAPAAVTEDLLSLVFLSLVTLKPNELI